MLPLLVVHFLKSWEPPTTILCLDIGIHCCIFFLEVILFELCLIAPFSLVLFHSHWRLITSVLCIPGFSRRQAAGLWNFFTLFICTLKDVMFYVTVILKVWVLCDFIWFLCRFYVFCGGGGWCWGNSKLGDCPWSLAMFFYLSILNNIFKFVCLFHDNAILSVLL